MTQPNPVGEWRDRAARPELLLAVVAVAAVVIPLIATAVRNVANGWLPIGDNAYFTVRSRDVLTEDHPLLGAWSSGSLSIGTFVNNLGPLQLDLLAPFTKLGPAAGTIVGVIVINVAAVLGAAYVSRRVAGTFGLVVTMAVTATVTWSMGSQMLIEPRQHSAMVLPFLCYLVAVWAVTAGSAWALWIGVVSGSLALQTHLSYAVLVPALAVPAIAGLVIAGRRMPGWWADNRRHVVIAGVVALACWAQPLWDQFFGDQNMTSVLDARGDGASPGLGTAAKMLASIVALPPWWGRQSFAEFDPNDMLPGAGATWLGLGVLTVLLVATGVVAWRARWRPGVAAVVTALVALVAALATTAMLPEGNFGLPVGNYRWFWPLGAFCLAAVVIAAGDDMLRRRAGSLAVLGATGAALLFGTLNLPYSYQSATKENGPTRMAITEELTSQLDDAGLVGPVLIDRSNGFFGEPYTFATFVELQSLGVEFTFVADEEIYRWGDNRRPNGEETHVMTFGFGGDARRTEAGATRVAFADGLAAGHGEELDRLTPAMMRKLANGQLAVDLADASEELDKEFPLTESVLDGEMPASGYVSAEVAELLDGGFVSGSDDDLADTERWIDLQRRRSDAVAIYLTPVDG